jgi:hypothetical protein
MAQYVLWQQQVAYPAQQDRQLMAALWPRSGVVSGMAVTVTTGRGVNIAAGQFVVALGGSNASALCISDAAATVSFPAAPASGSNRIDLLVLTVHDPTIDAGSTNGFTFDVVVGVASSSPVPPATPADAAVLAQVISIGGQANLAQSNIVAPFSSVVPPASYSAGSLAADLALPNGVATVVLQTGTLPVGVWKIDAGMQLTASTDGALTAIWASVASGTATLTGQFSAETGFDGTGGRHRHINVAFLATVTSPAQLNINAQANVAATALHTTPGPAEVNPTAWTAFQVA